MSGPDLAATIGAVDIAHRYAAFRVLGGSSAPPGDDPIEQTLERSHQRAERERSADAERRHAGARRDALTARFRASWIVQDHGKGNLAESAWMRSRCVDPLLVAQLASKNATLKGIAIEGLARAGDRAKLGDIQSAIGADRKAAACCWLAALRR